MNRGYVKLWRVIKEHKVFQDPVLFKVFCWCLLKATHKRTAIPVPTGRGVTTVTLEPGQLIFGRFQAARDLGLSPSTTRRKIERLANLQILTTKADTHFSVISIINWQIYQSEPLGDGQADGHPKDRQRTQTRTKEHKEYKPPCDFSSEISVLRDRYPNQETIDQAFRAIQSTRKSNRIADGMRLSILKSWERFPVEQVMGGIGTYLEKAYADQGRNEKYLLGIIRNFKPEASTTSGQVMKATGSILDDYYRGQGIRII